MTNSIEKILEERNEIRGQTQSYSVREIFSMLRDGDLKFFHNKEYYEKIEIEDVAFIQKYNIYSRIEKIILGTFSEMLFSHRLENHVYQLDEESSMFLFIFDKFLKGEIWLTNISQLHFLDGKYIHEINSLKEMITKEKIYMHSVLK